MLRKRLARPIGKRLNAFRIVRETREVESQLAADDQFLQEFVRQEFVLARVILDCQCHLER